MKASNMKIIHHTPVAGIKNLFRKRDRAVGISVKEFENELTSLQRALYNYITKSLNFIEDADDVYQETITRAYKYLGSYKTELSKFRTWIFRIASNEIKRYYSTQKEDRRLVDRESAPAANEADETVIRIYEAASTLTSTQRRIFFLFYEQGFSIKEIAGITELKEGNIKTVLSHARTKIREVLK